MCAIYSNIVTRVVHNRTTNIPPLHKVLFLSSLQQCEKTGHVYVLQNLLHFARDAREKHGIKDTRHARVELKKQED